MLLRGYYLLDLNEPGKRGIISLIVLHMDMKYDKDNNIIAAAQDRILKLILRESNNLDTRKL